MDSCFLTHVTTRHANTVIISMIFYFVKDTKIIGKQRLLSAFLPFKKTSVT